jgi:hypothetical protein
VEGFAMSTGIVEAYGSLDRGWRACILAAAVLAVALFATAI